MPEEVGQGFVQVVAENPPDTEPVGDQTQEQTFRADIFEEHHELQPEENYRINGGASQAGSIAVLHQLPNKGEIEDAVQVAIEVCGRHQFVERDAGMGVKSRALVPIMGAPFRTGERTQALPVG
jgi:hypothetical protein